MIVLVVLAVPCSYFLWRKWRGQSQSSEISDFLYWILNLVKRLLFVFWSLLKILGIKAHSHGKRLISACREELATRRGAAAKMRTRLMQEHPMQGNTKLEHGDSNSQFQLLEDEGRILKEREEAWTDAVKNRQRQRQQPSQGARMRGTESRHEENKSQFQLLEEEESILKEREEAWRDAVKDRQRQRQQPSQGARMRGTESRREESKSQFQLLEEEERILKEREEAWRVTEKDRKRQQPSQGARMRGTESRREESKSQFQLLEEEERILKEREEAWSSIPK
ncbi:trichohyalin-like isoform X2 [Penaeus japonicus]|uniref:trichohyalin-like isoform X2 n=1 Tax=Penaeus japonicus TaxID=27405 RepID=UPI001C70DCF4|nr:trichohyalin-like isoform X2 [Penaeus japonicus]